MEITDLKWISWKINFLALNVLLMVLDTKSTAGISKDYCTWEKFEAKCGLNEVVMMDAARYGRMRIGKCVKRDFGYLGCAANVLTHIDSVCSGKRECSMTIPDQTLRDMRPCSELEAYLQAQYSCVKVLEGSRGECNGKRQLKLTKSEGTIASTVAQQHGFGTRRCPWVISAKPGQRINVTLVDFGLAIRHTDDDKASSYSSLVCQRYAHIKEDKMKGATVCGGEQRVKNIYLSEAHQLTIEIIPSQSTDNAAEFLLQYEVVGCAAPEVPGGAKWERRGDTAYVTCNATGAKWELKCKGNKWKGKQGNCTDNSSWDIWHILSNDWSTPQGILLVTCLGIALGIVIGLILLACALLCLKRKKAKQLRQPVDTFIIGTEVEGRHDSLCYNDSSVPLVNGNKIIRESEYQQYRCKNRAIVPPPPPHAGVPVDTIMPTEKSDSGSSVGEFPPPPYPENMSHPRTFTTFHRGLDDHVYECAN